MAARWCRACLTGKRCRICFLLQCTFPRMEVRIKRGMAQVQIREERTASQHLLLRGHSNLVTAVAVQVASGGPSVVGSRRPPAAWIDNGIPTQITRQKTGCLRHL